jgi:predicted PurR-regulated permease PerM
MIEINKKNRNFLLQIIAFAILLFCGVQNIDVVIRVIHAIIHLFSPFLVGGAIAFIIHIPMKKIEKIIQFKNQKFEKLQRVLAYLLTLVCMIGVLTLALLVIIPELIQTIKLLTDQIPVAFHAMQLLIEQYSKEWSISAEFLDELNLNWSTISTNAIKFLQSLSTGLWDSGIGIFTGVVSGITNFVIAFTFSVYLIFQKETLIRQGKQVLYALLSKEKAERCIYIGNLSNQIFSNFLSGQCVEAVILGAMFVVTMSIFQLPYAMLIGIVIALMALIPIVGSFIGCAVGVFLIVMVNPIQAIWFLILFLILQQVEGNLIYPYVVGGSVGLPSIWVLAAVVIGGNLFGILGILFFIPLCSILYSLFKEFVKKRIREKNIV